MTEPRTRHRRFAPWTAICVALPVAYLLSSGPVLTTAFWLREST